MFTHEDNRYRYAVNVKTYKDTAASSWTQHATLGGAIRSARSLIGGRKYRIKDMETCLIWDKHTNALLSVNAAERLLNA
jgi:hypothetical protein